MLKFTHCCNWMWKANSGLSKICPHCAFRRQQTHGSGIQLRCAESAQFLYRCYLFCWKNSQQTGRCLSSGLLRVNATYAFDIWY